MRFESKSSQIVEKQYDDVWIENTTITGHDAKSPLELLEQAAAKAIEAVGSDNPVIDDVHVVSQTWGLLPDEIVRNCIIRVIKARLHQAGIQIKGKTHPLHRAFSNSQPLFANAAEHTDLEEARNLVIAVEPQNFFGRFRGKAIAEGVEIIDENSLGTMLNGLSRLTDRFREYYGWSEDQFRSMIREASMVIHNHGGKNPESKTYGIHLDNYYDDPKRNRPIRGSNLLTKFDCCIPISKAAAVVLSHSRNIPDIQNAVRLLAHTTAYDLRPLNERLSLKDHPINEALFAATESLFENPHVKEREITRDKIRKSGILELHNAVTTLVLLALIEMQFQEPPEIRRINPSGGLSAGHPLAATYPNILHSTRKQLLGKAGPIQIQDVDTAIIQSVHKLRCGMSNTLITTS
jgi:hypothetical protein